MGKAAVKIPSDRPPSATRYEDDLFSWVQEQVALLKSGRLDAIDACNIAEELGDVGSEQYNKLESAIAIVCQHILKWDHQPSRRSRSWQLSIRSHRARIRSVLDYNPGLKSRIGQAMTRGYRYGRDRALDETGLTDDAMPEICPFTFEDLLDREFVIAPRPRRKR